MSDSKCYINILVQTKTKTDTVVLVLLVRGTLVNSQKKKPLSHFRDVFRTRCVPRTSYLVHQVPVVYDSYV